MTLSNEQRRAIYREELRKARAALTPSMPGRLSGAQVSYAKGRARKAASARIDALT
jgi:hypothetical protein